MPIPAALVSAAMASGAAALVHQVLWIRRLTTTFGAGPHAVAVVLGIFFLGLGLGARLAGTRADRAAVPARGFAILELALAVAAVAALPTIHLVEQAYFGLAPLAWPPAAQLLLKAGLAVVLLLPPSVAMGATLPFLVRAGLPRVAAPAATTIAALYGLNTLGAALGALVATFVLLPSLGLTGSFACAAGLNVAAAITGAYRARASTPTPAPVSERAPPSAPPAPIRRDLLVLAAAGGVVGVGLEVLWTRGLSARFTSSVYSYGLILTAYLSALGAGSLALAPLFRRCQPERLGALAAWSLGLAGIAGLVSIRIVHSLTGTTQAHIGGTFAAAQWTEVGYALLVMGIPCVFLGATLPAVVAAVRSARDRVAGDLGRVYWANTLGAVVAAPLVTFSVLPILGLTASIVGLSWVAVLLAGWALSRATAPPAQRLGLLGAAVLATMTCAVDLRSVDVGPDDVYIEGSAASVAVLHTGRDVGLKVNHDYRLGSEAGRYPQQRQGLLPLLLQGRPARALFLGLGTGSSVGAAAAYGGLEVEATEILPELPTLLHHFAAVNEGLHDRLRAPNVAVHAIDARHYVRGTSTTYDVVVGDLFTPWRAGEGAMYSREHFAAVRSRLGEHGLFCQWLPLYQLGVKELRTIAATFLDVFPNASLVWLYFNVRTPTVGLVGSDRARSLRWTEPTDARARLLEKNGITRELASVAACWICDRERLAAWVGSTPVDTIARPITEFTAPRQHTVPRASRAEANLAAVFSLQTVDVATAARSPWFVELAEPLRRRLAATAVATTYATRARSTREFDRDDDAALDALDRALRLDPDWNWLAYNVEQIAVDALTRRADPIVERAAATLRVSPSTAFLGDFYRARLALARGDRTAARTAVQAALDRRPDHAPSRRLLERIDADG